MPRNSISYHVQENSTQQILIRNSNKESCPNDLQGSCAIHANSGKNDFLLYNGIHQSHKCTLKHATMFSKSIFFSFFLNAKFVGNGQDALQRQLESTYPRFNFIRIAWHIAFQQCMVTVSLQVTNLCLCCVLSLKDIICKALSQLTVKRAMTQDV